MTVNPAKILNIDGVTGELTKGSLANFIITSKPIFEDKVDIYENWVLGIKHVVKKEKTTDKNNNVAVNDSIKENPAKTKDVDFVPVTFPNKAWKQNNSRSENLIIRNATVWTSEEQGVLKNTDVAVSNGLIVAIGKDLKNNNSSERLMEKTNI